MPTILMIRHGENDHVKKGRLAGRLPDVHLNETGHSQAQALAEKLAGAPIKALYSSPLERARETAEPLAAALKLPVLLRDGLMETDCGEWSGKTLKSLRRLRSWKVVQAAPSRFRFPSGETFAETQYRITREIDTLCGMHDPKDMIACVSHADPIKLAVAHFIGLPLDQFQRLVIAPGSISVLQIGEIRSQLLSLNYYPAFSFQNP